MTIQLRTQRFLLRPVDEADLDVLLALRNAPAVVATTGTGAPLPRERMALEIGVVVHPDHWGRGIATEVGLAAARDLFERVGLDRVYAGVDPGNARSLRAVAKAPGVTRVDGELFELTAEALGLVLPDSEAP